MLPCWASPPLLLLWCHCCLPPGCSLHPMSFQRPCSWQPVEPCPPPRQGSAACRALPGLIERQRPTCPWPSQGCAAGVMVTASHNPKHDNGYKVYWGNGCQIIPPHDSGIAAAIDANLDLWELPPTALQVRLQACPWGHSTGRYIPFAAWVAGPGHCPFRGRSRLQPKWGTVTLPCSCFACQAGMYVDLSECMDWRGGEGRVL